VIDRAAILAVGSELLTSTFVDTNSLYITGELERLGVCVAYKSVVGDDRDELAVAIRQALSRVDLLVCTGGLGPTDDDVTREVVAEVLGRELREDARITAQIEARFVARGLAMPAINRRQAMVPAGAIVLDNRNGTAPGLWIDAGEQVVVLLPGPPRELKPMLADAIERRLAPRTSGLALARRVIRVTGRTESQTEEAVRSLYDTWARAPVPVSATILASLGQIDLHLTALAATQREVEAVLAAAAGEVVERLGLDVYSDNGLKLERVVGDLLIARGLRMAVAESCTGGLLASRLTDVPGSSQYVDRGIVAYANAAKVELLGVPQSLLDAEGAVNEPVAVAMATGVAARAGVEVGVGVTGIAGPDGGTPAKPVGTVAIAAVVPGAVASRTYRFVGDREQVKFQSTQAALDMVRRALLTARP
jgi:nicotinamide-nucleotide amidase